MHVSVGALALAWSDQFFVFIGTLQAVFAGCFAGMVLVSFTLGGLEVKNLLFSVEFLLHLARVDLD